MDLAQLQDFVEEGAPTLTKLIAGATPEFAVKIKLKGKVLPDEAFGLIHGKAGVITRTDGSRVSFIGKSLGEEE